MLNTIFFQHLQFSSYCTPFVCFKPVFTFYVAPPQKKCARSEVFSPLLGGVNTSAMLPVMNYSYLSNPTPEEVFLPQQSYP